MNDELLLNPDINIEQRIVQFISFMEQAEYNATHDSQNGRQREEHVKIFYRNDTQREPQELKLPGCGHPCFLSNFLKNTQSLIPVDYESECQVRSPVLLNIKQASVEHISAGNNN
ncbi:unnamed protein product [Allacma fusca]|uniref:Uncharacterized protein n=1 Tax=Allacma fusca TaxID=39272 RepID=A0A8J2JUU7_9HEXA|nr:unnamed protein product [Allacma fusca]